MTKELEDYVSKKNKGEINDSAFIDPTARMIGNVMISSNSSLWPGAILNGEKSEVDVGEKSIVMNNAEIEGTENNKVELGENSFISPGSKIKGSKIGKDAVVGLDAVVMDGAEIGEGSIVGTNAIVPEGMKIPKNSLVMGQPAEVIRDVSNEEMEQIKKIREHLFRKRDEYKIMLKRGEQFKVYDTPKRPDKILEEYRENLFSDENEKDFEEIKKKVFDKIDSENYHR